MIETDSRYVPIARECRAATLLVSVAILLLLATSGVGEGTEPAAPIQSLHFRVTVGADSVRTVTGQLVESIPGVTGLDTARLDLDGDGSLETERRFRESRHSRTKAIVRDSRIPIRHEQAVWTLELDRLRSPAAARSFRAGATSVHWSVRSGDLHVRFMEGSLMLHASAEAARADRAFRMGPPLRFEIGSSSRGPHALVTVALRDLNGGKLGTVQRGKEKPRPSVLVLAAGEVKVSGSPGYS